MCDWLAYAALILTPIYEQMKRRILSSRVIWTDDTPVDLQDREYDDIATRAAKEKVVARVSVLADSALYKFKQSIEAAANIHGLTRNEYSHRR